jgi:hypothetical protein
LKLFTAIPASLPPPPPPGGGGKHQPPVVFCLFEIILKNQIGKVKFYICNIKKFLKNPFFTVQTGKFITAWVHSPFLAGLHRTVIYQDNHYLQ